MTERSSEQMKVPLKETTEHTKEGTWKRTNKRPKWTKNEQKFDHGQFWMLKAVLKTLQYALVRGPGRLRAVPGVILGRPWHANSARESSKRISGLVPKRSRTVLESCPNKFGAASGVAHDHGTMFCYFCCRADAAICVSYQFLQCFVGFARSKQ